MSTPSPLHIDSTHFLNRELSWLKFNRRVLAQAYDERTPLAEKLKFLSICSSNLDEFYMIRVANLREIQLAEREFESVDGLSASEQLRALYKDTQRFVREQYAILQEQVLPAFAEQGVSLVGMDSISEREREELQTYFRRELFPVLTPLTVDPSHPFPYVANLSLNLIVELIPPGAADASTQVALLELPHTLDRLIRVSPTTEEADEGRMRFVLLDEVVGAFLPELFPSLEIAGSWSFRVTRNADLALEDAEVENLMQDLERELRDRTHRSVSRLSYEAAMPPVLVDWLVDAHQMDPAAAFSVPGPLDIPSLMTLYDREAMQAFKYPPFTPRLNPRFLTHDSIFRVMRDGDVLMHHPYESFATTAEFISHAARDPHVLAIKLTLYRTSGDSVIVRSLIEAARNGKQVTAVVELKARFDEENNISWARELERAGAHVVYGMIGLKTHCKAAIVVRREKDEMRRYVHLSTGNYNSTTARFYTDVALLTCDSTIAEDVLRLFNVLTSFSAATVEAMKRGELRPPAFDKLSVAPVGLRARFEELIDEEIRLHRPEQPGLIRAKFNSLSDERIVRKLYEASQAGVRIELNVRGICTLRPGMPGVSETIRVTSIVDRFLEHPRIFHFGHGGQDLVFLSSADWMTRNLNRRVEVLFPIEDEALRQRVLHEILDSVFKDNVSSWDLGSDGIWHRNTPGDDEPFRAQQHFMQLARSASEHAKASASAAVAKAAQEFNH